MARYHLNGSVYFEAPEELREMTSEEIAVQRFIAGGAGVCLTAPECHMAVTAAEKKLNAFSALVLTGKDLAKNMERKTAGPMAAFGYKNEGFLTDEIGGRKARGCRYSYTAQGIPMTGESMIIKLDRNLYFFHFYSRTENLDENLKLWEKLLSTVRF